MSTPFVNMTVEQRQTRWREIFEQAVNLSREYEMKSSRAKSFEKQDYWWNRYRLLSNYLWKNSLHSMRLPGEKFKAKFGETDGYVFGYVRRSEAPQWWKQRVEDRQERGRQKFLNTRYFAPWFMSNSLGADYGEYTCDNCNRTFYHSPSTITKAGKVIIHCCCGHCTNRIIMADHGKEPFD